MESTSLEAPIEWLDEDHGLTIELNSVNRISTSTEDRPIIKGNTHSSLTIKKAENSTNSASLSLEGIYGNTFDSETGSPVIVGFTSISSSGLKKVLNTNGSHITFIYDEKPSIDIAGSPYTESGFISSLDGVSLDYENNTLYLSNATIEASTIAAIDNSLESLTIILNGTNEIISASSDAITSYNELATLNIVKDASDAGETQLIISAPEDEDAIVDFRSISYTGFTPYSVVEGEPASTIDITYDPINGIKQGENKLNRVAFVAPAPSIMIDGFGPDADGKFEGLDGVTFTPANNNTPATLSLVNANIRSWASSAIEWLENGPLYVQFSGTNSIKMDLNDDASGDNEGFSIQGNGNSLSKLTLIGADNSSLTLRPSNSYKKAISGFTDVQIDKTNGWGMYYTDDYSDADPENPTAGEEVVLLKDYLGIAVAGVPVTSSNASEITGDFITGSVSFDSEKNILTLDGANIELSDNNVYPVVSSIENLTVKLIGKNEATLNSYSPKFIKYSGKSSSAQLTFETEWSSDEYGKYSLGDLTINDAGSIESIAYDYTISNSLEQSASYIDPDNAGGQTSGWKYSIIESPQSVKVWYLKVYDLWIGSGRVISTALEAGQSGGFSYDPVKELLPATSTNNYPIKSSMEELVISVKGPNCGITPSSSTCAITFQSTDEQPSGKLKFVVAEGAEENMNKFTIRNDGGAISGFSSVTFEDPLKLNTPATTPTTWDASTTNVVISDEIFYDLWVMGQQVTSANASDIFGAAQSSQTVPAIFDAEESTLTLNGLQLSNSTTYPTCIESGLESLTVTLSGDNKFQKGGDVTTLYGFKAQEGKTCNITFTTNNSGSLSIAADEKNAVVDFNKVTYNDGLAPYMWSSKFIIAPVTLQKPAFIGTYDDEDTGKLLSVSIDCHATSTIDGNSETVNILAYDVVYTVDGGSETAYSDSEPITISGPCTLTAKTIVGNTSSDVATGKYFGAKKDAFTMAIGESLADLDWCTPTFNAETEYIICKFISESNVFNYDVDNSSEAISAKATGTGTVNVELSYNDAMVTQILNGEKPITFTINVGEGLSSVFEGSNDYGGLYNDSDTPYALPEGTTAYLITGISEDGTSVTTEPINYIPAHTAILLQKGEGAKAITKVEYKGELTETTNNKFYYSDPNSPATAPTTRSWYVIYNNQFVKVTGGTQVKGGKCYLDLGTTAGTRGFYNIGGGEGTTSLREVKTDGVNNEKWTDGEWYTLQGQRVAKPAKGLYILNGKKVVVK